MQGMGEDAEEAESPDKRLALYRKMRQELLEEETKHKEEHQKHQMEELNKKIEVLEKQKQDKAGRQKEEDEASQKRQQERSKGNSNFLGNIKTFNVEDIWSNK